MAEAFRRGGKKYLGIDFAAEDYEALREIALEDGDRGVSSLVRSIVRAWLRARQNANLPAVMSLPVSQPASRQFNVADLNPAAMGPPPSAADWTPSNPNYQGAPKPSGDKDKEDPE